MISGTVRNSKIELLKILACFMIVISHSLPRDGSADSMWYVDIHLASNDCKHVILSMLSYLGQIGNGIFMVCSAWFLTGREKISFRRIVTLWIDTVIISVLFLLFCFACHIKLTRMDIVGSLMPVTFKSYWFITCYICFYCISPLLNRLLNAIERKDHFNIIVVFVVLYMLVNMVIPIAGDYWYSSDLVSFIQIFLIVSYLKKYYNVNNISFKLLIFIEGGSVFTLILLILFTNIIGLSISAFSSQLLHWASINNPLIVVCAISLFIFFNKMKPMSMPFVDKISSLSLLIYLFHANPLFSAYIRPMFYNVAFRARGGAFVRRHQFYYVLILAIGQFTVSCILGYIYEKIVFRIRSKLADKFIFVVEKSISNIYLKIR